MPKAPSPQQHLVSSGKQATALLGKQLNTASARPGSLQPPDKERQFLEHSTDSAELLRCAALHEPTWRYEKLDTLAQRQRTPHQPCLHLDPPVVGTKTARKTSGRRYELGVVQTVDLSGRQDWVPWPRSHHPHEHGQK